MSDLTYESRLRFGWPVVRRRLISVLEQGSTPWNRTMTKKSRMQEMWEHAHGDIDRFLHFLECDFGNAMRDKVFTANVGTGDRCANTRIELGSVVAGEFYSFMKEWTGKE